jgi:hypothetical protein
MKSTRVLLSLTLLASTPCILKASESNCRIPTTEHNDAMAKVFKQLPHGEFVTDKDGDSFFTSTPLKNQNHNPYAHYVYVKDEKGNWTQQVEPYKEIHQELIERTHSHYVFGSELSTKPRKDFNENSLFRRKRYDLPDYNKDHNLILTSYAWTTDEKPSVKPMNKSTPPRSWKQIHRRGKAIRHKDQKPHTLAAIRNALHTNDTTITKLLEDPKANKNRLEKAVGLHKELQQKLHSNLAVLRTLHDTVTAKQEVSTETQINQLTKERNAFIKTLNLSPAVAYYVQATIDAFTNKFNVRPEEALQIAFGSKLMTGHKRSQLLPMAAELAQYFPDTSWWGTYEPEEVKNYNTVTKQLKELATKIEDKDSTLVNDEKLTLLAQQEELTQKKTKLIDTIHAKAVEHVSPLVQDKLWKDTQAFEGKVHDMLLVSREIKALQNTQATLADARKAVGAQIADHVAALAHKKMKTIVQEELEKVVSESSEGENNRQERRKALWQDKALRQKAIMAAFECNAHEASILASFESEEKDAKKDIPAAAKKNSRKRTPRRKAKTS